MSASEDRICQLCGAGFTVRYRSQRKAFCTRSCAIKSHINNNADANPNWRGGKTKHPLYEIYVSMIQRCHNPNAKRFFQYGDRGIYVCDRWRQDFWNFVEDMGERPLLNPGTPRPYASLDRINNDGPYSPENCRWATHQEQADNSRRRPPQPIDPITGRFVPSS